VVLTKTGLTNIGYGTWRLNYKVQETEIIQETKKTEIADYKADSIIGTGQNSVYVYYYDTYRKFAESYGKRFWECKIGRTDKEPLQRIFSQAGTCYPELPHIALIIKCERSSQLESALHSVLKFRNRWIENAPGTEWFITSPEEVESIYQMLIDNKF